MRLTDKRYERTGGGFLSSFQRAGTALIKSGCRISKRRNLKAEIEKGLMRNERVDLEVGW